MAVLLVVVGPNGPWSGQMARPRFLLLLRDHVQCVGNDLYCCYVNIFSARGTGFVLLLREHVQCVGNRITGLVLLLREHVQCVGNRICIVAT
jgi:hypothetical protein